LAERQGGDGA